MMLEPFSGLGPNDFAFAAVFLGLAGSASSTFLFCSLFLLFNRLVPFALTDEKS